MGPRNGIVGDEDPGFDALARTEVDPQVMAELSKTARFSKTAEYKALKEYWEQRIAFYQTYLPDGKPVGASELTDEELGHRWRSANVIIGEFKAQEAIYEQAAEEVKNATAQQKRT